MLKFLRNTRFIVPILAFLHGVMLMALFVLSAMSNYEDDLYDHLLGQFTDPAMSQQDTVLSLLHTTHALLEPRHDLFEGRSYANIRDKLFRSADVQLNDAKWSCGSYTHVLARLLQRADFEVRLAQMKCGNVWGCHIILEAKVDGRFVSLDALYDLAFTRPDGRLASFKEVGRDWSVYRKQVPTNYELVYAYEDVRYTNWGKIPLLMPAAKQVFKIFLGPRIETVSVRSWTLNLYQTYWAILFAAYLALSLLSGYVLIFRRKYLFQQ